MGQKKSIWRLIMKATGVESKLSKINGLADKVSNKFANAQDKINRFTLGVKEAASEIPYLGRGIELATNPIVAMGGALLFTIGVMGKAVNTAGEFNYQFLELQQLNLDKSVSEIDRLNRAVLDTAFSAGMNATKTAEAYYNLQSSTGKYGAEIDKTVVKLGNFSTVTKANFEALVNGAGKAIKIFKLSSEDMDSFLASSAKTVQMGVTTFDQLANVQVDYFGGAAAAGQGFDEANKLFAALTIAAKSPQEAATLTKTAFQGLIDPNVQKGLAKYGINLFDASGKMKKLDLITKNLVDRLKTMSDQQFSKFMGEVGGPEGLKTVLNTAKSNGEALLDTFKKFDNTKFDIDKALKNANGDFQTLKNLVGNRINVIMVRLGQQILPTIVRGLQWFNEKLITISTWFQANKGIILDTLEGIGYGLLAYAGYWAIVNFSMMLTTGITALVTAGQWLLNVALSANPIGIIIIAVVALVTAFTLLWKRSETFRGTITGLWESLKTFGTVIKEFVIMRLKQMLKGISGIGKALMLFFKGDWKKAWEAGKEAAGNLTGLNSETLAKAKESGKKLKASFAKGYDSGASKVKAHLANDNTEKQGSKQSVLGKVFGSRNSGAGTGSQARSPKLTSGINSISGGGKSVRNVKVTIQKLVEEINIHSQDVKEGTSEIRDIIQEELIKALQGYEIAAG
ncbi:phage tail tape measure protein [Tenacibaculum maritimum]|uniref:phage tail tape measure protein n=1 Tax=Tenacibaculum maritimum TaxID=107401 RepID=UPI000463E399|nr:phage tail tape measure protein [Tenacibaculum maritimum]CAA0260508.1 Phage tail tape measure protein [Tenacibaculum maritimum]